MFNYGSFKVFLLKVFFGLVLIFFSLFFIISILTYNQYDPAIGKLGGNVEVKNFFGFWGSVAASFFIILFGKVSLFLMFFAFYTGTFLALGMKTRKLIIKTFLILVFAILLDYVFLLQNFGLLDNGLISKIFSDVLFFYLPNIVESVFYNILASFVILIFLIVILLYCFSIKIIFLKKLFFINIFTFIKPIKVIGSSSLKKTFIKKTRNRIKNEPTITRGLKNPKITDKQDYSERGSNTYKNDLFFNLPDVNFLIKSSTKNSHLKEAEVLNKTNSEKLEKVLAEYGVEGKVMGFKTGPIVTLYEFVPNAGIKASKVIGLSDDIARAMSSVSARISSQPGKTSLGIEIPNTKRENVMFGDLIENSQFERLNNSLTLALGKDISGQVVYADLEKMPHLLIAGTTGSGKSVGINTIIMSILYRFKPDECKLILIDPKMLELSIYEDIPHLLTPVVTNPNKAVFALKWVVREMENRYKLMSSLNVKNINSYNDKSKKILSTGKKLFRKVQTGIDNETRQPVFEKREIPFSKMPFIVVVIDEMADLMMVAGKEVENLVQRLAQMARASGIHLVTATQRPSVDVITGTIKANFPSRLSYKVASKFDSRTILNEMGAEQLLGSGDMLFLENGSNLKRLHGGFISEQEIEKVVNSIKEQSVFDQKNEITIDEKSENESMAFSFDEGGVDDLYGKAVDIVVKQQKVSTSYIQRYLQIGYNRAARIIEKMEEEGIISEANNAGKRQVLKKS